MAILSSHRYLDAGGAAGLPEEKRGYGTARDDHMGSADGYGDALGPRSARTWEHGHTYASLLLSEGAPPHYVAEQMGHPSAVTTLRFYAKWMPTKGRRWVDSLDRRPSSWAMLEPESGTTEEVVLESV